MDHRASKVVALVLLLLHLGGESFEFAFLIKPMTTNNQAKYEAILKGLQLLHLGFSISLKNSQGAVDQDQTDKLRKNGCKIHRLEGCLEEKNLWTFYCGHDEIWLVEHKV